MSEFDHLNNNSENLGTDGVADTEPTSSSVNDSPLNENGCTYHGPANDGTYQSQPTRQGEEYGQSQGTQQSYNYNQSQSAGQSYGYSQSQPTQQGYGYTQSSGSASEQNANTSYYGGYAGSSASTETGTGTGWSSSGGGQPPQPPEDKKKKAKRAKKGSSMTAGRVVALGLCCAFIGGIVGGVGVLAGSTLLTGSSSEEETEEDSTSNTTSLVESARTAALENETYDTTGEEMTAAQIYEANVNSCVGITVSITYNIFGYTSEAAASGSGFIISSDGYIVTNYHVVEDADTDGITVTLYDDTTYEAELVGYDSSNDVAVLKVDATDLTPVVLGDSDTLSVGDTVVAIGNPLGELTFSLTAGIVSALDREVTVSSDSSGNSVTMNLIQTDAAINSGNSGGALFNEYGEVIGITNAKYSSSSSSEASIDNIGFAIPINTVKSIIESIIENGYVEKPYLGVTLQTYSYTTSDGETVTGAMIYSVESGSAADEAGLQRGDLITAIDGEEITSSTDATNAVSSYAAGDEITITIDRNGTSMDVSVTLGAKIESATDETEEETTTDSESSSSLPFGDSSDDSNSYGSYGGY